jgi:hypothetical protein
MPRPVYTFKVLFEALCGDAEATLRASKGSLDRNHGIEVYVALGFAISSWARAQLGERETGLTVLRRVLTEYADKGNKTLLPFCHGLLAEVETTVDGAEAALARIDEALLPARRENAGLTRFCTASEARSCSSAIRRTPRRPRKLSVPPSPSRRSRKREVSNYVICSLRSMGGSPKASTLAISKRPRRCLRSWRYEGAQALGYFYFEEESGVQRPIYSPHRIAANTAKLPELLRGPSR